MTLKVANEQKLYGEQFAWFAGTKVGFKPKLDKCNCIAFLYIRMKQPLLMLDAVLT